MGLHVSMVAVRGKMAEDGAAFLAALGLPVGEETAGGQERAFPLDLDPGFVKVCVCRDWSFVAGDLYPPAAFMLRLPPEESRQYRTLDSLHESVGADIRSQSGSVLRL